MVSFLKLLVKCLALVLLLSSLATPKAMALPAPAGIATIPSSPTSAELNHFLNRVSLGPNPKEIKRLNALGIDRYLQQQLDPGSLPEPTDLQERLAQHETLKLSQTELNQTFRPTLGKVKGMRVQPNQAFAQKVLQEAIATRLDRAINSPHQLQEVMVDFWFNHFNVYSGKSRTKIWVGSYDQEAIRPHALGQFRDLLGATAQHPAMLFYLDNWRNTDPNSPNTKEAFKGFNENYARELMELHTLGVDGGYTQADVESLTRILTGWTLRMNADPRKTDSSFHFAPKRHNFSDKQFLGQTIPGTGQAEVQQALDLLATHPATAQHISYKLAQYFVADEPPPGLVDRLAQTFRSTEGDIAAVLGELFNSDEFWDERYYNNKFKTPYQYVISTVRLTEPPLTKIQPKNLKLLQNVLRQSGMPVYGCKPPDGYGNLLVDWLSPDGLSRRLDFATTWMRRQKLQSKSKQLFKTVEAQLAPETQAAIAAAPKNLRSALVLGSPELMWR